jgi:hypothetical protein
VAQPGKPAHVGTDQANSADASAGCVAQLIWGIGGFTVLIALAVMILRVEPWTFSIRDALYWLVTAAMIVARYVDVRRYGGKTSLGAPAHQKDVWKYALGLAGAAAALWVLVQAFRAGPGM